MKMCSNCNKFYNEENNSNTNFCPYCGKKYEENTNNYKQCKKCNSIYALKENDESNFCPFCGEKFEEENTSENNASTFELDHYENKRKYTLCFALYFVLFYGGSIIVSIIASFLWLAINNLNSIDQSNPLFEKYSIDVTAWYNFGTYILVMLVLIPLTFNIIKKDFINFKTNPGNNFKWFGFGVLIMYGGIIISSKIVKILSFNLVPGDSANQELIVSILKSGGINMILMSFMTVIFAPIIEEIVFRKCLFGLFKKNTIKTVILSTIIFAGIHTIPTCIELLPGVIAGDNKFTDLYLEFIYIFQYLGQAFALAFVYHKTKGNLIPCIMIHFLNNFISILGTLFLY